MNQSVKYKALFLKTLRMILGQPVVFIGLPMIQTVIVLRLTTTFTKMDFTGVVLANGLVEWVLHGILSSFLIAAFRAQYFRGKKLGIGELISESKTLFFSVMATLLSVAWRVVAGLFLFVIPGVILFYRYLLAIPFLVFEGVNGDQALENSEYWLKGLSRLVLRLIGQHLLVYICYLVVVAVGVTGFAQCWALIFEVLPAQNIREILGAILFAPMGAFGLILSFYAFIELQRLVQERMGDETDEMVSA